MLQHVHGAEELNKKSPRPIMRTASWFNFTYGMIELAVGASTGSSAAASNGVHSIVDAGGHAAHTATDKAESEPEVRLHKVLKRRRIAAGAIAVSALLTGYNSVDSIIKHQEEPLNQEALAVELGSAAFNLALLAALRRRKSGTLAYNDTHRHISTDLGISVATVTAIAVNPMVPFADGLGGLIASGASGYLAYRTARFNEADAKNSNAHTYSISKTAL